MSFCQQVVRILRHAPGQRLVLLTRQGDRLLTTRFFLHPVKLAFDGLVDQVTVTGEGSIGGLPETLTLALEGYRVRAGLGELAGLPAVVAAGVTRDVGEFLPDPGEGLGYAYVSTHFIAGESLAQVGEQLATGEKLALVRRLLRLLARLHERLVVYGDLKPHNVIAVGEEPWLIDLDTMRRVPRVDLAIPTRDLTPSYAAPEQTEQQLTYLASDMFSFGRLGNWLLDAEPAEPAVDLWRALFARMLAEKPDDRPGAAALLDELGSTGEGRDDDPAVTVPVLDILEGAGDESETVQAWAGVFSPGAGDGADKRGADGGASAGGGDNAPMVFRALTPPPTAGEADAPAARRAASEPPDAPAARRDRAQTALVPPRRRAATLALAGGATAALFAAVYVAVSLVSSGAAQGGQPDAAAPAADAAPPADAGPPPFRHCGDGATRVIVASLSPDHPVPPPSEILSWFSGVAPEEVEIYRFSHQGSERRFISFELSQVSWSEWHDLADDAFGQDLCRQLGNGLADLGLGPPGERHRGGAGDFVFLGERADRVTDLDRVGDLRGVANGDTYAAILDWLAPLELDEPHCRARGGWVRESTLDIHCAVRNPRERTAAVRVVATMLPDGLDPVERDRRVILDPGEATELTFTFDEYVDRGDTFCDCAASTLP